MALGSIQNTNIYNQGKIMHNYLRNMPCKRRRHFSINFGRSLFAITYLVNSISKLQNLLEHNQFGCKLANKIQHSMLIFLKYGTNKKVQISNLKSKCSMFR